MNTLYSKIVVPFDGSELSKKALETAVSLTKQDEKIELDVISVLNIPPSAYSVTYGYSIEPFRESLLKATNEALNEVTENLKALPNQTRTFVLEGSPAPAIVDFITDNDAKLVVMGSRGLSGLKELFLGSVSHYVVQKSPCPVFIVK